MNGRTDAQTHKHTSPRPTPPRPHVLTPYILIALLLTGCLIDTTPKTPVPPTPTPTPRPTPTETPGVLPIRQPTIEVTRPPRVTATPPGGVATVETRANGQILYISLRGGRRDIMSIDATGGNRRQLVAGTYESPVWAPDGNRFVAYGATTPGGLSNQLAVFDDDGRALARYPIDGVGVGQPVWSPDGRYLLCILRNPSETTGTRSAWVVDVMDGDDLRPLTLPDNATPWRWTPDNRLAYIAYPPGGQRRVSQSNPLSVWSIDPADRQARKEAEGVIAPLGWSPDGQTFYAFDGLLPAQDNGTTRATHVVAIDRRTGNTRTLISADNAANAPWRGTPGTPRSTVRWFEGGSVAPIGGHLALLVYSTGATGSQMLVAMVDESGQLLARDATRPSYPTFAWSSGGAFVAYIVPTGNSGGELHILSPNGDRPIIYPVTQAWVPGTYAPSWSPDSRWVAIVGPDGLTISSTVGSARNFPLDTEGTILSPAWRPTLIR